MMRLRPVKMLLRHYPWGLDNLEVKDISHKIAILEQLGNS